MLKSYSNLNPAATNSEQSTRGMFSAELETIHTTTIDALPKLESVNVLFVLIRAELLKVVGTLRTLVI